MAVSAFSDEEFEKACESLVGQPDVDEPWEFFTESHGVKIYRLYNKVELDLTVLFLCCKIYICTWIPNVCYQTSWREDILKK